MYAVFSACGKQYKVKKGDTVRLELLPEGLGETVSFSEVLLAGEGSDVKIGRPFLDKAAVKAEVLSIEKGPKLEIVHYKRRKQFKRHVGHRQPHTRVLITEVSCGSTSDALSKQERDSILKRVGFGMSDAYAPVVADEASQAKKAEKQKAKAEKKAKAVVAKASKPAAKKASGKASAKKASGAKAKAPAKKAAKKDE